MKRLIMQLWFCAITHPAQSLINMASVIGKDERVEYLVSNSSQSGIFLDSMERLRALGKVESYIATTPTGDSNTVRALLALWRALLWPLFSLCLPAERISVLHLLGRMVRKFGCSVIAPVDHKEALDLFLRIPRPGCAEYAKLLKGMDAFRQAYSAKPLRGKVIQKLLG